MDDDFETNPLAVCETYNFQAIAMSSRDHMLLTPFDLPYRCPSESNIYTQGPRQHGKSSLIMWVVSGRLLVALDGLSMVTSQHLQAP